VFKFRDTDRFVIAHNTLVNWNEVLDHWAGQLLRGITRNNLWVSVNGGPIWLRSRGSITWETDLDFDGFDWGRNPVPFRFHREKIGSLRGLHRATGQQSNGVRIRRKRCFDQWNVPGPPPLASIPSQHLTLATGCEAIDAGEALPNLSDGYTGSAPDLGAHEAGGRMMDYGPR
jgi:hypothetical protein